MSRNYSCLPCFAAAGFCVGAALVPISGQIRGDMRSAAQAHQAARGAQTQRENISMGRQLTAAERVQLREQIRASSMAGETGRVLRVPPVDVPAIRDVSGSGGVPLVQ